MIAPGVWFEAVRIFMRLSPNCPTVIAIGELSQLPLSERPPRVKQFHGVIELNNSGGGYSHLASAASTTVGNPAASCRNSGYTIPNVAVWATLAVGRVFVDELPAIPALGNMVRHARNNHSGQSSRTPNLVEIP